jgi:hypothetical protein
MMNFSARLSLIFVLREGCFVIAMGYGGDIASISEKMRRDKAEFDDSLFIHGTVFQNRKTRRSSIAKHFSSNDRVRKIFEFFFFPNDRSGFIVVFSEWVSSIQNRNRSKLAVDILRFLISSCNGSSDQTSRVAGRTGTTRASAIVNAARKLEVSRPPTSIRMRWYLLRSCPDLGAAKRNGRVSWHAKRLRTQLGEGACRTLLIPVDQQDVASAQRFTDCEIHCQSRFAHAALNVSNRNGLPARLRTRRRYPARHCLNRRSLSFRSA